MKKVVDNARLIYKCCKLYYEDDLTQNEIADMIGISRLSVSRMIKTGREIGIVQINVISPNHLGYTELEKELERVYGLKEAVVVESEPLATGEEDLISLRNAAISLIETYLRDGDIVGVSMGKMLHNIVNGVHGPVKEINCTFVPIVGGVSYTGGAMALHSNQIAYGFAELFGGSYEDFFSPAMFSQKEIMRAFMQEKSMARFLSNYRKMKTVIVGIGRQKDITSTMMKAGYIRQDEVALMVNRGMVGDVSLQFFDIEGRTDSFRTFNERVAGLQLDDIKNIQNRIGISVGEKKAEAVHGAIAGGFVNILVTDEACAEKLLAMKKNEV